MFSNKPKHTSTGAPKDTIGRSVKITFLRTTQRLKSNRKYKIENDFESIDDMIRTVKTQQARFQNIVKLWKKYLLKETEFVDASKQLDKSIITFWRLENVYAIAETSEEGSLITPIHSVEEMHKKHERFLKELKEADNMRQNYFACKRLYEKASDPARKEIEKRCLEDSEANLRRRVEQLLDTIPKGLEANESKMHENIMQYFKAKEDMVAEIAKHTKEISEQLRKIDTAFPSVEQPEYSSLLNNSSDQCAPCFTSKYSNLCDISSNGNAGMSTSLALNNTLSQANNISDLATKPKPFNVVATFAYKSDEQDELEFDVGDEITVQEWPDPDDEEPGWLYGSHQKSGKQGLFPANHVRLS